MGTLVGLNNVITIYYKCLCCYENSLYFMLLFCCTVEEMVSEQLETAKNPDLGDVVCVCVASMCCVASQHSDQ